MSPFLVYLMMQADTIGKMLLVLAVLLGLASIVTCVIRVAVANDVAEEDIKNETKYWRIWTTAKSIQRKVLVSFLVSLAAATCMPSTKTVALMVVLPKLTSPKAMDAMGTEAADLYKLAKEALHKLADDKPPTNKQ